MRFLQTGLTILITTAVLFSSPSVALANEGDGGDALEAEVNGYHVTLTSQNDWAEGENAIVVTLADGMGMPVGNAGVEVAAMPAHDESAGVDSDSDGMSGMDMSTEAPTADSMSGMDMATETPSAGVMRPNNEPASESHDEEPIRVVLEPAHESGEYAGEIFLDRSGAWIVNVHFTVNDEMLAVEFPVEVPGSNSKTIVLWSFVAVNVALVASAGIVKKQKAITVKGA